MAQRKGKGDQIEKRLHEVDKLFKDLANDKSLPTFGEHFMHCLMLGVSEKVNLKAMYPKTHKKLSIWLQRHNQRILTAHKIKTGTEL